MQIEPVATKLSIPESESAQAKGTLEKASENRDRQVSAAYNRIKAAFERATNP